MQNKRPQLMTRMHLSNFRTPSFLKYLWWFRDFKEKYFHLTFFILDISRSDESMYILFCSCSNLIKISSIDAISQWRHNSSLYLLILCQNKVNKLLKRSMKHLNWFKVNELKPNANKFYLLVCNKDKQSILIEHNMIESADSVELFGVTLDENFKIHIQEKSN